MTARLQAASRCSSEISDVKVRTPDGEAGRPKPKPDVQARSPEPPKPVVTRLQAGSRRSSKLGTPDGEAGCPKPRPDARKPEARNLKVRSPWRLAYKQRVVVRQSAGATSRDSNGTEARSPRPRNRIAWRLTCKQRVVARQEILEEEAGRPQSSPSAEPDSHRASSPSDEPCLP